MMTKQEIADVMATALEGDLDKEGIAHVTAMITWYNQIPDVQQVRVLLREHGRLLIAIADDAERWEPK